MEDKAEKTAPEKYEEAKKAGDLEAMFAHVNNGEQVYCARSKCNGVANFITKNIPKIKHVSMRQANKFNWFSIQKIDRCEGHNGDEETCCVQIVLQPTRKGNVIVNPIRKLLAEIGLCKDDGGCVPILCSTSMSTDSLHDCNTNGCFSFADRALSCLFDKVAIGDDHGAQTLLSVVNSEA